MTLLAGTVWTLTNDDGTGQTGTIWDQTWVSAAKASIEAAIHSTTNPTVTPVTIIDEVVAARGSKSDLDARLDVALNEDGTLKTIAGQATQTDIAREQGQRNLVYNGEFEIWDAGPTVAPTGWTFTGAGSPAIARSGASESDTTTLNVGQYAVKMTQSGAGGVNTFVSNVITTAQMARWGNVKARKVAVSIQAKTSVATFVRVIVDDGVLTTASSYHTGGGTIEILTALHTLSATATKLDVYVQLDGGHGNQVAYVGGVTAVFSDIGQTNWIVDAPRGPRLNRFGGSPGSTNGTTVETDLYAWSVPPLDVDGEGFDLQFDGSLVNNANTKTIRIDIAGVKKDLIVNSTGVANNIFTANLYISRRSTSVFEVAGIVTFNAAHGAAPTVWHIGTTITTLDMTRTQLCKITGQSSAASADITLRNIQGLIRRF